MLTTGKIAKDVQILGIRELTRDDLALLRDKRQPHIVQRLRDPHHLLARLISAGLGLQAAANRAGYSYNRASQLVNNDPAFKELLAQYRKDVHAQFLESVDEYAQLATGNMLKAERMLADKLEDADDAGESLPTRDLIAISRDAADRFGYGKKATNVNVNVDFAAQLERTIARSGKVINGAVEKAPLAVPGAAPPSSRTIESPQPFRRRA